jgi:colanic acid/amylovoran biosynthesis glycosyltransferase
MLTIAYISNQFPSPVEPYVVEEIRELRRRGVEVIPCSARRSDQTSLDDGLKLLAAQTSYLQPLRLKLLLRAAWLCLRKFGLLADLFGRVLVQGRESPLRRARALLHTWLGVYYALLLEGRGVRHIHAHHGYFGSWIAMVAARWLGAGFSMTLHGSDLLLHSAYLDTKLKNCSFCLTVSAYNRWHILMHYPEVPQRKIMVQRMGVDPLQSMDFAARGAASSSCPIILAVGRLHPVKDHAFLIRACRRLKDRGMTFLCLIAGEGPERTALERLICRLDLQREVALLGHVPHHQLDSYYVMANLVVLTSRSEGVPLALMEAMVRERTVLAPAITGIPELVKEGQTGFLYRSGSLQDFVARVETICNSQSALELVRRAARQHVLRHYNREKNLTAFGNVFLDRMTVTVEKHPYENSVLQQI